MFHFPSSAFTPAPRRSVGYTVFHRDGSRTNVGPAFCVRYDPDGNATVVPPPSPREGDQLRYDLAA